MTCRHHLDGIRAANDDQVAVAVDLLHAVARGTARSLPTDRPLPPRNDARLVDAIVALAAA